MNLLFGATGQKAKESLRRLAEFVEDHYGGPIVIHCTEDESSATGLLSDSGIDSGHATAGAVRISLLGTLTHPLDGWRKGCPVDHADLGAAYILDRYLESGRQVPWGLPGVYLCVIVDEETGKTYVWTDPDGQQDAFYLASGEHLLFSSNLFSLANGSKDDTALDRTLEDFFLIYGFYPWNRTAYRNIMRLAPGKLLAWQKGRGTEIQEFPEKDPWLGLYEEPGKSSDENTAVELLYDAFMRAVSEQLPSSDTVAVLLGGADSAIVAAALSRLGKRVESYSFYYREPGFNQQYTDTVASHLGIKHNWIQVDAELMRKGHQAYALHFNQPTNWANYVIQTNHLCREMRRREIYHCYSGDGCDALFMGYPNVHLRARLFSSRLSFPEFLYRTILRIADWDRLEYLLGRPYSVALGVLRNLRRDWPEKGLLTFRIMDEYSLERLRTGTPPPQDADVEAIIKSLAQGLEGASSDRIAYKGKSYVSPNRCKMVGSMHNNGIAVLSPYLHPGMKRLAQRLPDSFLRPGTDKNTRRIGKYLLLKMAEEKGLMPREVLYQKKFAAVDSPIDDWYMGPLKEDMLSLLQKLPFRANERYVNHLLRRHPVDTFYKKYINSDRVGSHILSLLATYASFTALFPSLSDD